MNTNTTFIEKAKAHLEQLGSELSDLEARVSDAGQKADEWTSSQADKLKKDWETARDEMTSIAERIETEGDDAVSDAREKAERHWDALQAAVKAYRDHLDTAVVS